MSKPRVGITWFEANHRGYITEVGILKATGQHVQTAAGKHGRSRLRLKKNKDSAVFPTFQEAKTYLCIRARKEMANANFILTKSQKFLTKMEDLQP